jgi:uncharacterized protein with HEPN domain
MSPDDRVRLRHIVDAIGAAAEFIEGRSRDDLNGDRMLVFALVRAVEIVGEAAGRLSDEVQGELSTVPWRSIAGMRNRLIHAYYDVDLDILWNTVSQALPPLGTQIEAVLEASRPDDG